jgi:hypothetical protein
MVVLLISPYGEAPIWSASDTLIFPLAQKNTPRYAQAKATLDDVFSCKTPQLAAACWHQGYEKRAVTIARPRASQQVGDCATLIAHPGF